MMRPRRGFVHSNDVQSLLLDNREAILSFLYGCQLPSDSTPMTHERSSSRSRSPRSRKSSRQEASRSPDIDNRRRVESYRPRPRMVESYYRWNFDERERRSLRHSRETRRRFSRSPSPFRRFVTSDDGRERAQPARCLGIFGMNLYTEEETLRPIFSKYGKITKIMVVRGPDFQSRGFGFVYYSTTDEACRAKDALKGISIDGKDVRIDFSVTRGPRGVGGVPLNNYPPERSRRR